MPTTAADAAGPTPPHPTPPPPPLPLRTSFPNPSMPTTHLPHQRGILTLMGLRCEAPLPPAPPSAYCCACVMMFVCVGWVGG